MGISQSSCPKNKQIHVAEVGHFKENGQIRLKWHFKMGQSSSRSQLTGKNVSEKFQ